MKSFEIKIEYSSENTSTDLGVLDMVYNITANMAVQRGDALHVATEDNKLILEQFAKEGEGLLVNALGRYSTGKGLGYSMPENWVDAKDKIDELAKVFLANYISARWFDMSGTGEKFLVMAKEALNSIPGLLNKRRKPL